MPNSLRPIFAQPMFIRQIVEVLLPRDQSLTLVVDLGPSASKSYALLLMT